MSKINGGVKIDLNVSRQQQGAVREFREKDEIKNTLKMNKSEKEALTALNKGEGHLHWVIIEGSGLWLYISSFSGKVFKYNAEDDVMTELKLKGVE